MDAKELKYIVSAIAEKGSEAAFEQLFRRYFVQLVDYIQAIIHHRPASEDIAEDIFVNLWQNRNTLHTIKSVPYYLYAAAKNRAINYLTRDKNNKYVSLDNISEGVMVTYRTPESHLSGKEELQIVMQAIDNLPAKCQAVFRLVKEEGLSYKEAADVLEISPKTVENQMTIAFRKIFEATKRSGLQKLKKNS